MRNPLPSIALLLLITFNAFAADALDSSTAKPAEKGDVLFYDARALGIEGQGWTDVKAPYDRLPGKAEGVVRDVVWNLSRDSTGMAVRFVTDATTISARWMVQNALAKPHMAATGVSGVDLYVRNHDGKWRWLACGQPKAQTNAVALVSNMPAGQSREFMLYFPLFNRLSSIEVGVPKGVALHKPDPRPADTSKPIVFYGTSITHGACASRPGMVHPAILGRRFDRPVINLGFSGNGRMEPEVAALLAELDPAVFSIDCLPNMDADAVTKNAGPLVKTIRAKHPDTPILLVEDRTYADAFMLDNKRKRNDTSRVALKKVYESLVAEGVKNLHYLEGEKLLPADGDGTVDASHPNDYGFVQQADTFEPVLRKMLGDK